MVMELTLNNGVTMPALGLDRAEVFIETKVWVSDYGYDETLHAWEKADGENGIVTQAWSPIGGITFYPGWGGEDRRNVMQDPNFDVFDFELSEAEIAAIDALDTGERNGPDPDEARPERFAMAVPEA
jgi:diketogulonate reductase-like aldo/keto reductase